MLLLNFDFIPGDKTTVGPVDVSFKSILLKVKNDVHIHLKKNERIKIRD